MPIVKIVKMLSNMILCNIFSDYVGRIRYNVTALCSDISEYIKQDHFPRVMHLKVIHSNEVFTGRTVSDNAEF